MTNIRIWPKVRRISPRPHPSALLMPAQDILGRIRRVTGLTDLVLAKKRWGVSVAALAYRLHKLGILSDWQYRGLCIEMNQIGYRTSEPCVRQHPA